jgi:hypothetical protein
MHPAAGWPHLDRADAMFTPCRDAEGRVSCLYACVIAASHGWGEATVRTVMAPLSLEDALARLAQRHAGEIGRVLRLPAALPQPGTVLKDGLATASSRSAWRIRGELGRQRRWRRHAAPDAAAG